MTFILLTSLVIATLLGCFRWIDDLRGQKKIEPGRVLLVKGSSKDARRRILKDSCAEMISTRRMVLSYERDEPEWTESEWGTSYNSEKKLWVHFRCKELLAETTNLSSDNHDKSNEGSNELCTEMATDANIQPPHKKLAIQDWTVQHWGNASEIQKIAWVTFDCSKELKLYDAQILTENDQLPEEALQSTLSDTDYDAMIVALHTIIEHMNSRNISYFAVFGTLLSTARNGILLMPWDDDVDLAMEAFDGEEAIKQKMTTGLIETQDGPTFHCEWHPTKCRHWQLPNGVYLTWKDFGTPWKITRGQVTYPVIDINTFSVKTDPDTNKRIVEIPTRELTTGHIHSFRHAYDQVYPLVHGEEIFVSSRTDEKLTIPRPNDPASILKTDYGNDAMETCRRSYNHRPFCHQAVCESPMANHVTKLQFPCSLLPKHISPKTYRG